MMQIIKKWKIIAYFDGQLTNESKYPLDAIVLFVSDNFYSNVLRKVSEIEFSFSPSHIEISEVKYPEQQGIAMP